MAEVTIRDVASEAGLSVSSVSRILRGGQGHVYPAHTRDRVREVAERLGYQANAAARLLRQSTRTLIGMSVHHTEHPHLNRFLVSVREGLVRRSYDPVIFESSQLSGSGTGQCFPPPHMLAGLISLGIDLERSWPAHFEMLHRIMPIIAIQAVSRVAASHIDVIHVDYTSAFLQGIQHLQQLRHRHIAYLGPVNAITPIDAYKHKGWKSAAKQAGLDPNYVIPWNVERSKARKTAQIDVLMSHTKIQQAVIEAAGECSRLNPRPTALICASDEVAICLQSYLLAKGWNLPRDLSIIGYDGIAFGALVFPALTTIEPDYDSMADAAICRLLHLIGKGKNGEPEAPEETYIAPHLIVRGSTAPPLAA